MTTEISTILTVGMPTLAVMVGILVNNARLADFRIGLADLRADMNRRFDAIEKRLDRIEAILERHESRITILEERTNPLRPTR